MEDCGVEHIVPLIYILIFIYIPSRVVSLSHSESGSLKRSIRYRRSLDLPRSYFYEEAIHHA